MQGETHVLPSLQWLTGTALRKHLLAAIKRAELVKWIGNSEPIAAKHYLQVTDDHFTAATCPPAEAVRNAVRGAGVGNPAEPENIAVLRLMTPHGYYDE